MTNAYRTISFILRTSLRHAYICIQLTLFLVGKFNQSNKDLFWLDLFPLIKYKRIKDPFGLDFFQLKTGESKISSCWIYFFQLKTGESNTSSGWIYFF